jgi:hypothetical protein
MTRPQFGTCIPDKTAIALASLASFGPAAAQVSQETIDSLSAPGKIETRIGTLEFSDGVPRADMAKRILDTVDFTRALNVYNNSFGAQGAGAGQGLPKHRREKRRHHHLRGADGFEFAVPDGECRYRRPL